MSNERTFGCPVYVVKHPLQAGSKIPKWELRANLDVYVGKSPFHVGNVSLVMNCSTTLTSPQFHLVFDENFTTLDAVRKGPEPPNWNDICMCSTELTNSSDLLKASTCDMSPLAVTPSPPGLLGFCVPAEISTDTMHFPACDESNFFKEI